MTETGIESLDSLMELHAQIESHHEHAMRRMRYHQLLPDVRDAVLSLQKKLEECTDALDEHDIETLEDMRRERNEAKQQYNDLVKGLGYLESLLDAARYEDARISVKGTLRQIHWERWGHGECRSCHRLKWTLRGICAACVAANVEGKE